MKNISIKWLVSAIFLLQVNNAFSGGSGAGTGAGQPTPSGTLISCEFPTDIPSATASQSEFDEYSWRMFTSLNQPASTGRGKPDCSQSIGSTSNTVWRSFKLVNEIFLPDAKNPGPWSSASSSAGTVINSVSKVSSDIEGTINQPVGGWLIDQRQNPTYYQIAANETSYNYIIDNGLYNKNTAESFSLIKFPDFSTEIKASWRILTEQDFADRYMTTAGTVTTFDTMGNANGTAEVTLGLAGLHIITKATGFPQWVWATFEQVDNVSPTAAFSSYYNASAAQADVNQSPCANHATPCVPVPGSTFQTPNPLTRVTPIAATTASINVAAQGQLNTTFLQYYELVTTQWPSDPNDPGNPAGSPTPGVAANSTMESYIQPTSSCMDCHSGAVISAGKKSDFSFLFLHAQVPPTISPTE